MHNDATADEALYHLRAAVAALAAACDSLASLAAIGLELDLDGEDPLRGGVSQDRFRQALKKSRRESTRHAVIEASPFLVLLKALRNPIVHQAGPSGRTVHHGGGFTGFTESEITELSVEQVEAIRRLPGGSRRSPRWGLRSGAPAPSLAPLPFVTSLALEGMTLIDRLPGAIAVDLELPPDEGSVIEERKLARLRLLSGFDPGYAEEVSNK